MTLGERILIHLKANPQEICFSIARALGEHSSRVSTELRILRLEGKVISSAERGTNGTMWSLAPEK